MTDNGKPKYFSLMEQLRNDIVSGAIRPGEKLRFGKRTLTEIFPEQTYSS